MDVAEVNQGAGWSKVDSGLKMLIEPIYFWLVASQYYKKVICFYHLRAKIGGKPELQKSFFKALMDGLQDGA